MNRMIKLISAIIIGLVFIGCASADNNQRDIIVDEPINNEILKRLKNLELVNSDTEIIGLWYSINDEQNSKSEDYTFITADNLVRYYQFGDKEPKIFNIPINKILSIEKKPDPIETSRLLIKVKRLGTVTFNESKQENEIFDEDFDFRPPYGTDIAKQERFFDLLINTWTENNSQGELVETYSEFYDSYGNLKITDKKELARNKLNQLKYELDKLPFNIVNRDDFIVAYKDNEVFLFRYDYVDSKYLIFKVVTGDIVKDDLDATTIVISIYPIHRHGNTTLPYTNRGYTVNSAFVHYETEIKKIIEKHI